MFDTPLSELASILRASFGTIGIVCGIRLATETLNVPFLQ